MLWSLAVTRRISSVSLDALSNQYLKPRGTKRPSPFLIFADHFVAFAVKSHGAAHDVPEGVLAGMRVQVVFAAVF